MEFCGLHWTYLSSEHGDPKYFAQTVTSRAKWKFADEAELLPIFSPTKGWSVRECAPVCMCVAAAKCFPLSALKSRVINHAGQPIARRPERVLAPRS